MKYSIEVSDFASPFADYGPWRSHDLSTEGNSLRELIDNAQVFEVDQDGGELGNYPLSDMSVKDSDLGVLAITREYERKYK